MTGVTRSVSARLRPWEHQEWARLGGVVWLRKQLAESIKAEQQRQNPTSIAQRVINAIKLK
jgi:hypothetical protein